MAKRVASIPHHGKLPGYKSPDPFGQNPNSPLSWGQLREYPPSHLLPGFLPFLFRLSSPSPLHPYRSASQTFLVRSSPWSTASDMPFGGSMPTKSKSSSGNWIARLCWWTKRCRLKACEISVMVSGYVFVNSRKRQMENIRFW